MSQLRIYFGDLIAFVPAAADSSHWILLPEARQPTVASDGVTLIDPHYPVVLFDLANQGASDWNRIHRDLKLTDPPGDYEAWLLGRQELQISVPVLPVETPGTAASGLPQPNNRTHFSWVPNLASLGIPAKVDPDCLRPAGPSGSAGQVPSTKVVSRLHLESGKLTTFHFVTCKLPMLPYTLQIPLLEFRKLGEVTPIGTPRACADAVMAVVDFSSPTIKVSAVDLETGATTRSLDLTPVGGFVDVLFGNLSPKPPAGPMPRFGAHFERYYDLQATPPADRPIPYLVDGFPNDPSTYVDPLGINHDYPAFIRKALQIPLSGFNPPICSLVQFQS